MRCRRLKLAIALALPPARLPITVRVIARRRWATRPAAAYAAVLDDPARPDADRSRRRAGCPARSAFAQIGPRREGRRLA